MEIRMKGLCFKRKPGNIYSGDYRLAILTNPTELAKKKGNLIHSYPINYKDTMYIDVETAYQKLSKDYKKDTTFCYALCIDLIEIKLKTYPKIYKIIKDSGGINFLSKCSHWVWNKKINKNRWEGDGMSSGFICCLIAAYERIML